MSGWRRVTSLSSSSPLTWARPRSMRVSLPWQWWMAEPSARAEAIGSAPIHTRWLGSRFRPTFDPTTLAQAEQGLGIPDQHGGEVFPAQIFRRDLVGELHEAVPVRIGAVLLLVAVEFGHLVRPTLGIDEPVRDRVPGGGGGQARHGGARPAAAPPSTIRAGAGAVGATASHRDPAVPCPARP